MQPVPILMTAPYTNPTGWNPADATTGGRLVTLTNNNRTMTGAAATGGQARATQGRSSGKWYWELIIDVLGGGSNDPYMELVVATPAIASFAKGPFGSASQWGLAQSSPPSLGHFDFVPGAVTGNLQAPSVSGVRFGMAIDFAGGGKMWISKNGVQDGGNPVTGTSPVLTGMSGTLYPFATVTGTSGGGQSTVTCCLDSFNQVYRPSGFTAWSGA